MDDLDWMAKRMAEETPRTDPVFTPPVQASPNLSTGAQTDAARPEAAQSQAAQVQPALTRRELRERELAAATALAGGRGGRSAPTSAGQRGRKKSPKPPKAPRPVRAPRAGGRRQGAPGARPGGSRHPVARPSANRGWSRRRKLLSKLMTFGAMAGAGLMMVATSVPANAFFPTTPDVSLASAPVVDEVQSVTVAPVVSALSVSRDSYSATSLREQLFLRYGNRDWSYTNNPNWAIQWPFPIAVPISDGYGPRIAPCGGCSTFHNGVDFTPGAGTIIQAIADGVVSAVIPSHAGLGNHVIIDHHINGHLVQSVYGHMRDNSFRVTVGQEVKVTDELGLVGSTGQSTGSHLHLEIHVDGVPVDPFEWLKEHAG